MKQIALVFIVSLAVSCNETKNVHRWNRKLQEVHLKNIQDSAKWDLSYLEDDLEGEKQRTSKPFTNGVFPIPRYDIFGENSFGGMANGGNASGIEVDKKLFVYSCMAVGTNNLIKKYLADKSTEVFFTIVVLTDNIDTINYSHMRNHVVSRNHPDYIAQGFVKTKSHQIDYVAFLTAFRDEYAIVNMRLFNLKYGRIVLIAPQKDGSLRSMQLKPQLMSKEEIDNYVKKILNEADVKAFFNHPGTI